MNRDKTINIAATIQAATDAMDMKWFLCFGTLLYWTRDHQFNIEDDIDIGVLGEPQKAITALSTFLTPTHMVRDNVTGEPLNVAFKHEHHGFCLDLFIWKKFNGMYWHCFDEQMTFPADGILKEYSFKGIPCECFDVNQPIIDMYQKDIRYGRDMSNQGTWKKAVPGIEEEGYQLCLPFGYGRCLDIWYPDWSEKRSQFGVSECQERITVKSCGDIAWE